MCEGFVLQLRAWAGQAMQSTNSTLLLLTIPITYCCILNSCFLVCYRVLIVCRSRLISQVIDKHGLFKSTKSTRSIPQTAHEWDIRTFQAQSSTTDSTPGNLALFQLTAHIATYVTVARNVKTKFTFRQKFTVREIHSPVSIVMLFHTYHSPSEKYCLLH
jgi:hypothetical protein